MKTSEQIDLISAALSLAQGEFPTIAKTRDNPFFKSKYADLSDILIACTLSLSKNGLALAQPLSMDNGRVVITTRLVHKSGQWFEESLSMKPEKDTPQSIGSTATYGRRYGAEGMLGVSATQDDDGNHATGNVEQKAKTESGPPVFINKPEQAVKLEALFNELGIKDELTQMNLTKELMGKPLQMIRPYIIKRKEEIKC